MRVGSLFSGCGGLDLGLERAGFEIAWASEIDPACRRVLARHWPGLPVLADVRHVDDWLEPVDLLAGGFPCQDISEAGHQVGLDGARSGLWNVFADSVRLLRPRYVLVENVSGLAARGFGRVLADLAAGGYVGRWFRLRASDLGAPHLRERIFILATTADAGSERRNGRRIARAPLVPAEGGSGGRAPSGGHSLPARGFGAYEPTIRRWEQILGRAAPGATDARGRLSPAFVEWMLGFPDGWTEGERRGARLRMLGNAVQVQVAEQVGRMLLEADTLRSSGLSDSEAGHPRSMTAGVGPLERVARRRFGLESGTMRTAVN